MALATLKNLLAHAKNMGKGLGSFTVGNMEMILGAVKAAEETNTPIVIQNAEARFAQSPLALLGPMMLQAARDARVDVCVHLDHGSTPDVMRKAAEMGFTSVMFDGSHLSFADNLAKTREMAALARSINPAVSVEAELGVVGGSEDYGADREINCTDPGKVAEFCRETGIDALAIAIGNAHGRYQNVPKLRFDVLEACAAATDIPLVLHGGSGISDAEFRKCIALGIRKINIATALFESVVAELRTCLERDSVHDYRPLNQAMIEGTYKSVKKHIAVFNNQKP